MLNVNENALRACLAAESNLPENHFYVRNTTRFLMTLDERLSTPVAQYIAGDMVDDMACGQYTLSGLTEMAQGHFFLACEAMHHLLAGREYQAMNTIRPKRL